MDLKEFVARALAEDIGPGDLTTEACIPADCHGSAVIIAKQDLVVAGQEAAAAVFAALGGTYLPASQDGGLVADRELVGQVRGPVRAILTAERIALNLLMRLSGIATRTRLFVDAAGSAFSVVDTRKCTPLNRALEKAAVRAGGGRNHRFALYDGVLIKDNHIQAAGGVGQAVARVRASIHHLLRIEVEAATMEQAEEAVAAGADAVLLDNMDDEQLGRAVSGLRGRVLVEASGNMDLERIQRLRQQGIHPDLVSVGGLIHQSRWVDMSLRLDD